MALLHVSYLLPVAGILTKRQHIDFVVKGFSSKGIVVTSSGPHASQNLRTKRRNFGPCTLEAIFAQ
eukprot:676564-Pelagomonas_calceolata.AAC.3